MANLSLRNVDQALIDDLKKLTGTATAAKALVEAGRLALAESEKNAKLRAQVDDLRDQLAHKQAMLDGLDGICRMVIERTGQADLTEAPKPEPRRSPPNEKMQQLQRMLASHGMTDSSIDMFN